MRDKVYGVTAKVCMLVMCAIAMCAVYAACDKSSEAQAAQPVVAGVTPSDIAAMAQPGDKQLGETARRGLSRKQRKELGLTFRNTLKQIRKAKREGVPRAEWSVYVMQQIPADKLKAANADIDDTISFIERLIELIIKLMAIFADNGMPMHPVAVVSPAVMPAPSPAALHPFVNACG